MAAEVTSKMFVIKRGELKLTQNVDDITVYIRATLAILCCILFLFSRWAKGERYV
jgi:hypothetical protein